MHTMPWNRAWSGASGGGTPLAHTPLVAPSSAGNTAGASVGSDLCQHSTTSQLSRASRASTIAASGCMASSASLPSPSHTCHVCRKGKHTYGVAYLAYGLDVGLLASSPPRSPPRSAALSPRSAPLSFVPSASYLSHLMTETEIEKVGEQERRNMRPTGETSGQPQPLTTHTHTHTHTHGTRQAYEGERS